MKMCLWMHLHSTQLFGDLSIKNKKMRFHSFHRHTTEIACSKSQDCRSKSKISVRLKMKFMLRLFLVFKFVDTHAAVPSFFSFFSSSSYFHAFLSESNEIKELTEATKHSLYPN